MPDRLAADYTVEPDDRVQAFLYLLMRDHLPTGVVAELIGRAARIEEEPIHYTVPELGSLATRYADRIIPPPEEPRSGAEAWLSRAPERCLEELARAEGESLDLVQLAEAVGWNISKDDDMHECSRIVQQLYEEGFVARAERDGNAPARITVTHEGKVHLEELRSGQAAV